MIEEIDNILDYLKKAGLNTIDTNSPAWKILHSLKQTQRLDKPIEDPNSIELKYKKQGLNSIEHENGQKMTVGLLVRHRTVPQLGLGLVVAESKKHKGYWIVQWCDKRYCDVGELGIDRDYLQIV